MIEKQGIQQGIFLDFSYIDSSIEAQKLLRDISSLVRDSLSEKSIRMHVFKFGYGVELINSAPLRRIYHFDGISSSEHSFKISATKNLLETKIERESNLTCSLFSARYRGIDENHAKVLYGKKDYLVITELLGVDVPSGVLKTGKIYSLSNIFKY